MLCWSDIWEGLSTMESEEHILRLNGSNNVTVKGHSK
jgi:hypothetical protein